MEDDEAQAPAPAPAIDELPAPPAEDPKKIANRARDARYREKKLKKVAKIVKMPAAPKKPKLQRKDFKRRVKVKTLSVNLRGKKRAKAPKKGDGAQVCLSFRTPFYADFEKERAKIKDPKGKLVRPAKGKRPADLAWSGSRGAKKIRAISRSKLVEVAFAAWVKGGRRV